MADKENEGGPAHVGFDQEHRPLWDDIEENPMRWYRGKPYEMI